jgi:hypothetical protein
MSLSPECMYKSYKRMSVIRNVSTTCVELSEFIKLYSIKHDIPICSPNRSIAHAIFGILYTYFDMHTSFFDWSIGIIRDSHLISLQSHVIRALKDLLTQKL